MARRGRTATLHTQAEGVSQRAGAGVALRRVETIAAVDVLGAAVPTIASLGRHLREQVRRANRFVAGSGLNVSASDLPPVAR